MTHDFWCPNCKRFTGQRFRFLRDATGQMVHCCPECPTRTRLTPLTETPAFAVEKVA